MSETKGIYKKPSGNWTVVTWDKDNVLSYHGTYKNKDEAIYVREQMSLTHHWKGEETDESCYGFIYKVVNKRTKQIYFGRKVYKYWNPFTKKRDQVSGWQFYTTGSVPVQDMYDEEAWNLEFTILANVDSNDEASYLEWSIIQSYFLRKLPTGEQMCLNQMLPKLFLRGLEKAKDAIDPIIGKVSKELP